MKITNNTSHDRVELSNAGKAKQADRTEDNKQNNKAAATYGAGQSTSVNLSDKARLAARAREVARSSDTDQEKIARIKQLIAEGNYKPDIGKVADRVVNEHLMNELS